jgi:hypothetical protein
MSNYNIQYGTNDFFYKKNGDNKNLIASFPFTLENLKKWVLETTNKTSFTVAPTDIFDSQLSSVVIDNETKFKTEFLPNNMVFNSNFNNIVKDLIKPGALSGEKKYTNLQGSLTVQYAGKNKYTTFDISSNINIDGNGNIDIDANRLTDVLGIPITDADGDISYISTHSSNPRCKFRNNCTLNHIHYSGGCTTQTIVKPNGETYCKCICKGSKVSNGDPHSHCELYNEKAKKGKSPNAISLSNLISNIQLELSTPIDGSIPGLSGVNGVDTVMDDKALRDIIFKYYNEIVTNKELQKNIDDLNVNYDTQHKSLMDSKTQYKAQYLNIFNLLSGIFIVSGYIYTMRK